MPERSRWQLHAPIDLPDEFVAAVQQHSTSSSGLHLAQLLWQRGIREPDQVAGFLDANFYTPSSPFAFGEEMQRAVERLVQARDRQEIVAIWGDFDADGVTATAVLWDGLGQFFPKQQQLIYYIPHRFTESHGLSIRGIDQIAQQGCQLIVTCDTGSSDSQAIAYALGKGIDVIITDHHTLPDERPPVSAMINSRYLPSVHPLANLSGVAVAFKLVEALYQNFATPAQPLTALLDLVAIGLIADLVHLTGDCRYLAQRGIEQLQHNQGTDAPRPGIAKLLEYCRRSGDRPTDISFGIGPRINAISRIHGDAHFAVELLTSQDVQQCQKLAEATELANARRKALQKDVVQQVREQLAQLDLSTTSVIVLADPQWAIGVLGLVAGQIAQEYGRPTILLNTETLPLENTLVAEQQPLISSGTYPATPDRSTETQELPPPPQALARGSARSVNQIDLYQLVKRQADLLHRFGGHPYAAGLSLPVEHIGVFTEAINRQLREQQFNPDVTLGVTLQADLSVTVAELGKDLFRELKLIEPCGMGNPVPKLLISNCWFRNVRNRNIKDVKGGKIRYIKTEFEIWDRSSDRGFPGIWWEHYKDEVPGGNCDAIAELDFNTYEKRYEIRLIALRPVSETTPPFNIESVDWLLDWRDRPPLSHDRAPSGVLMITQCPSSWDDLQPWFRRAMLEQQKLAIAFAPLSTAPPLEIWQRLVGIAKYLSRTQQTATRFQLLQKLDIGDRALQIGIQSLKQLGFNTIATGQGLSITWRSDVKPEWTSDIARGADLFLAAVQEEQFRQRYFYKVPFATIQLVANQVTAYPTTHSAGGEAVPQPEKF